MSSPRSAKVNLTYNSRKAADLAPLIQSFQYTDVAAGASDSISLTLADTGKKFINSWMPKKGDSIKAEIALYNWIKEGDRLKLNCGKFVVDDFSLSGPELSCEIGAVSIPAHNGFKSTDRTKNWKKITLEGIAKEIAKRYKLALVYSAGSVPIGNIEQAEESDSDFLNKLCKSYGLSLKVFNGKICVHDETKTDAKKAVLKLTMADIVGDWQYSSSLEGTYTGAKISYTDPNTDKDVHISIGTSSRVLKISEKADNKSDAKLRAQGQLNAANRGETTLSLSVLGNTKIMTGTNITVSGLSPKIDGKYAVVKAVHKIGSGYAVDLELRKIAGTEKKTSKPASKPAASKKRETGDIVTFKGGYHYMDSSKSARGYKASAGKAKITGYSSGAAHPYHLEHTDANSNVHGWVDADTIV